MLLVALQCFSIPFDAAPEPHRKPIPDQVYLQETSQKILLSAPLTTVAAFEGQVYAGTKHGLYVLSSGQLIAVQAVREPVRHLRKINNALWAVTEGGLHWYQSNVWQKLSGQAISDIAGHLSEVIAANGKRLYRVRDQSLQPLTEIESPFLIQRVISHCESLYIYGGGERLTFFNGKGFGGLDVYGFPVDQNWDWGALPSRTTRDILSQDNRIYFATENGLGLLRGMSLTSIRGEHGLCYEDTTCLAEGFTNDLWIGTTRGAIRFMDGHFQYFAGKRWLPDDHVQAIAADRHAVYIATAKGLGIIRYVPFTLARKADYYEHHLEKWGQKRLGFTHKLEWDASLNEFVREVSDNDGGYSGNYLAAQCFRYAVTKDSKARQEAVNTFNSLLWLEAMTGIPGLPARSVWAKGEQGHKAMHGSGGYEAEWHDTADGKFEWKGDTSSDEICSHFYSINLFLEHVAQGNEIEQGKRYLTRVANHLVENGWKLMDKDGKPTRWGRWDPDYFKTDEGRFDRGLQALELLSFIKTVEAHTGDPKFSNAYRQLVEMDYPTHTLRQRQTFPPEAILHFEDELAWWSYSNLLRYEKDPSLRSAYRRAFERSYEVIRIEQNPWFNFTYGALTGNECEVAQSVAHLREWPLDLRIWTYQNSHRADLKSPPGYVALKGGTRTFSPRETQPMRWDHWIMQADGGADGREVAEPGAWLLAYWMGRYYGFIAAPEAADQRLLSAEPVMADGPGAKPYSGPARPSF